ncbi:hypothetical protein Tco_0868338 [Tanacetum coccineum]
MSQKHPDVEEQFGEFKVLYNTMIVPDAPLQLTRRIQRDTNFTCSADSPRSCQTYITYRARPPYMDLGNISDLFGVSRLNTAEASNLTSENGEILYDQLLLIPITCNMKPNLKLTNLTVGDQTIFPLLCKCPTQCCAELRAISYYLFKSKKMARNESSFEFTDLLFMKKASKQELMPTKSSQDKLLPGVSGYLSKPITYDRKEIMEATMNLSLW